MTGIGMRSNVSATQGTTKGRLTMKDRLKMKSRVRAGWRRNHVAVALLLALVGLAASSASAAAAPQFTVTTAQMPTGDFRIGDRDVHYKVTATNTGDPVPAGTPTTMHIGLPPGIAIRGIVWSGTRYGPALPTCEITGQEVSCTGDTALPSAQPFSVQVSVRIGDGAVDGSEVGIEVSGGGAPTVAVSDPLSILPRRPFGLTSFEAGTLTDSGSYETVSGAGSHPFAAKADFEINTIFGPGVSRKPVETVKNIVTDLPAGFLGNPRAIPRCRVVALTGSQCPIDSQVGTITVDLGTLEEESYPVYNMVPARGNAAQFGSAVGLLGIVHITASLRSDSDFGVRLTTRNIPATPAVMATTVVLWGTPADSRHDAERSDCSTGLCLRGASSSLAPVPFLSNLHRCESEPPVTTILMDSWVNPGDFKRFDAVAGSVVDCDKLTFEPEVEIAPTTSTPGSPTGLDVDMKFPTQDTADGLAPPPLKKAVVTMPEGMTVNPAIAAGLEACADDQLNLKNLNPVSCPQASKIGEVTATSPVLEETLAGGVYVRSQNSNDPESGEMFRIAIVLENEERGLSIRLPGSIAVSKDTGRIVTTFDNNPQLPVERIHLKFKDGPRAPLTTPPTCGTKTIDTVLTSWSGQTQPLQSSFTPLCGDGLGGFAPAFSAGTESPVAGGFSPFSLRVTRQDSELELKSIKQIKLPEGLLGDISSVALCEEAQAAVGVCPDASRVGHVQVAAGAGASPLWVPVAGKEPTGVYLTGPYGGAPYGLSIKVPAQAGPFDLGRVVVRSALHVDERTAAITSGVDETRLIDPDGTVTQVLPGDLPRILKGVVLNQREIRVIVDRENFMINPTDCSQQRASAEIYAYGGDRADVGNRFRAVECAKLGFKPRFNARILDKGRKSTVRSWHPRTRFTVVPRRGDANISGARVALPSSTILDQANIGTTCTRAQMAARACPAKSVVGYARAWSPLLRRAVEGPVYLAANGGVRPLPDLAAVLDGEIRVVLQGEISTLRTGGKARLQNTFRVVPDAPVSRFALTMQGGKNRGLLVNSTDLCRSKERGVAVFTGQNNRRHRLRPRIATRFTGCGKVRRKAARKAAARKAARKTAPRNAMKR